MKTLKLLRNFGGQWSIAKSEFHGITPKPSCFLGVSAALGPNFCESGHSFKKVAHPCSRVCKSCIYPTGREFSLEFRFHYFPNGKSANGRFAKFEFWLLLHYINLSMIVYMIKIQNLLVFISVNMTNLSQVAKLNSVYIFIQ